MKSLIVFRLLALACCAFLGVRVVMDTNNFVVLDIECMVGFARKVPFTGKLSITGYCCWVILHTQTGKDR